MTSAQTCGQTLHGSMDRKLTQHATGEATYTGADVIFGLFGLHLRVPLLLYVSISMHTKSVTYTYNHVSMHGSNTT